MNTYFYDAEQDTGEMDWLGRIVIQSPCIPASDLQPGQVIHYSKTHATTGDYQVVSTKQIFGGAVSVEARTVSDHGTEFTANLTFKQGESVEVVS